MSVKPWLVKCPAACSGLQQPQTSYPSARSLKSFTSKRSSSLNDAEVPLRTACPSMQFTGPRVTEDACFCIAVNMYPSA